MNSQNWNSVMEQVHNDDKNKWDENVNIIDLHMDDCGRFRDTNRDVQFSNFTDHAKGQLFSKLSIPAVYGKRIPKSLLSRCVNFDLQRIGRNVGGAWLMRAKGKTCRAILSEHYAKISNISILEIVEKMTRSFSHQVREMWLDERGVWMKILVNDLRAWDPIETSKEMQVGFLVGNSEVGSRSVSIEPFVYRKACTNDLVVQTQHTLKQRHIGLSMREIENRVARSVNVALESGDDLLNRFIESNEDPIENPASIIEKLSIKRKLTQKMKDDVQLAYESEPVPTRFGLINAFTSVARQLTGDGRVDLERFAGDLLNTQFVKSRAAN